MPLLVSWTAPDSGGADITSYKLQVRTVNNTFEIPDPANLNGGMIDNTGNTPISNLPGDRTVFIHKGVRAGVEYFYRVLAVNRVGESGWSDGSDPAAGTAPAAMGAPGAPAGGLTATPGTVDNDDADQIVLTWGVAPSANASPVLRYEIQIREDDDEVADQDDTNDPESDWAGVATLSPTPPTDSYLHA